MPVYIIRAGESGPVKIGFAENPLLRLVKMQSDNHEHLTIIRVLVGTRSFEQTLHRRFDDLHLRGEWFTYHADMLGDLGAPEWIPPAPVRMLILLGKNSPIARYLTSKSISVADFADSIGVTAQAVHRYIDGDRIPKHATMMRIASVTQGAVSANDIYSVSHTAAPRHSPEHMGLVA